MLNKGKLYELQTKLRSKICELNKDEARTFDLFWEITENIEKEKKEKEKPNKGRPKKRKNGKTRKQFNYRKFLQSRKSNTR